MSSGSPGRYQSRLFNFLNRQSIQLTDRLDRAVRNLKVAAVWGAQILIYPVYLLVQAGLSAGRQLSAEAQAGWPQLKESTNKEPQETPPTADTPIQRVLSEVSNLELQVERLKVGGLLAQQGLAQVESLDQSLNRPYSSANGNTHGKHLSSLQLATSSNLQPTTQIDLSHIAPESREGCWVIQGVASLLETRILVLITVHNEILDILTPQQQQKLSSRISWEVADLLRHRRIAQALDSKRATRRFKTLTQSSVFLPVRLLWQVMAWVQTSPVAIAANLFQESTLVYRPELEVNKLNVKSSNVQPSNLQPSTPVHKVLAFFDRYLAELESHQLVPGSEVVVSLSQRAKRRFSDLRSAAALRYRTQKRIQPLQNQFITPSPDASSEVSQTNTFDIQAIIYAAIDYFFGRRGSNLPGADSQEQSAILANPSGEAPQLLRRYPHAQPPAALSSSTDASEPDPWLTWGDLFGSPHAPGKAENSNDQTPNRKSQGHLPEAFNSKTPVNPRTSIWSKIKRYLNINHPSAKLAVPSRQEAIIQRPESAVPTTKINRKTGTQSLQIHGRTKDAASTKVKNLSSATLSSHGISSVSKSKAGTTAITTPSSETNLEPAHDWIETSATPTGYVKHPLEQLLESVDLAMLWLEELAVKVWRWVQQLGRRG